MSLRISPNCTRNCPQIPHIYAELNIFGVLRETYGRPRAVLLHYTYSSCTVTVDSSFLQTLNSILD